MTSTWLQARIAEKPELADQLNADNVGRKQRLRSTYGRRSSFASSLAMRTTAFSWLSGDFQDRPPSQNGSNFSIAKRSSHCSLPTRKSPSFVGWGGSGWG